MYSLFVILAVITAVLLAFVVLIQESKGGGLASSFAASNQIMGVRKTTDVVEKATWTLAALLVVFSVLSVFALPRTVQESVTTDMKAAPAPAMPQGNTPAGQGNAAPAQQ